MRNPGLWFVLLALIGTTLLHYLTDIHLIPYHSIYRSLYYLPKPPSTHTCAIWNSSGHHAPAAVP
jgi:hypothetical protein